MTEVSFHFNAPEKIGYACRLLRKAYRAGASSVVVVAAPETLRAVDAALWTISPLDFIPHCMASSAEALLDASPIVLAPDCAQARGSDVLVHLGETIPPGFERFGRLIELVGQDDADRSAARGRWRHYAERGYAIQRHDVAATQD